MRPYSQKWSLGCFSVLAMLFFSLASTSWAQSSREQVLFNMTDTQGNRVEIAVSQDGDTSPLVFARIFQNQTDLISEHQFTSSLALSSSGFDIVPDMTLQVIAETDREGASLLELWQRHLPKSQGKPLPYRWETVTDTTGTTLPPTGTNPPSGGGGGGN